MEDRDYMRLALELAGKGRGMVSPNPLVGTIIVKNGKVVGRGYHLKVGEAHAEINALWEAKDEALGATLYVNMEPCCHYGRTPPCIDRIIQAGVKRVVVGMEDPNPLVSGKGIHALREAGIKVEVGILAEEAKKLNEIYLKYISTGLPFVILKVAMSLDGKIATRGGESKWLTGEESRHLVHRLRSEVDAILVGVGTILVDDPELTVRGVESQRNPWRIILDSTLRIPPKAKSLEKRGEEKTVVATTSKASLDNVSRLRDQGILVWVFEPDENGKVDIGEVVKEAGKNGLSSLLIEGGSKVNASALKNRVVDKFFFFITPKIMGDGGSIPAIGDLEILKLEEMIELSNVEIQKLGNDFLISGYIKH